MCAFCPWVRDEQGVSVGDPETSPMGEAPRQCERQWVRPDLCLSPASVGGDCRNMHTLQSWPFEIFFFFPPF